MRAILITTAAVVLLVQPLAAQQDQEPRPAGPGSKQALSYLDMQFAEKAAEAGFLEIELGQLAVQQANDGAIKDFGQMMVDDHSAANQELLEMTREKGIQVPQELSSEGQQHKQDLQQVHGAAFDRQYMDLMLEDHRKDIETFERQAAEGLDPDLIAFAEETLPVLQQHLQRAREIQR